MGAHTLDILTAVGSDIYPETYSGESALTAEAWYGGADAEPKMFDMETLYTPESLPSSAPKTPISVVATTPAPAKTAVAPPKPTVVESANPKPASPKETPTPTEKRVPSPILVETTAKVADKNPEIPNPGISPTKPSITPAPARQQIQSPVSVPQSATLQAPPPTPMDTNIVEQLARITALLETQNKTLASQDRHISDLTKELDALKNKVDARGSEESSRKDEIIRKLELELEEARS